MNILFDLDGTLTDSASGILIAYTIVAEKMGAKVPSTETLKGFIGTPLRANLASFLPAEKVEEAASMYVETYDYMRLGIDANRVYDGVIDTLKELVRNGHALYLVTAKLEDLALPILSLFGIEPLLKAVYAAPRDGKDATKKELIARALRESALAPDQTVMIGDRSIDVVGARANNVKSIGVTWGYGSRAELELASPDCLVEHPPEILQAVTSLR